jgi:signal transduction histidine kinase
MSRAAQFTSTGTVKHLGTEPIDMVACVMHELRTPITAILAAGENIRDGRLDKNDLREEGALIIAEAMRLMNLGDQILLYAKAGRSGHRRDLRRLTAGEVIDHAVSGASIHLQQAGFTLEQEIQPDLPPLRGDLSLLSRCLHNLITNGMKYSGQSRWLGVSALIGERSSDGLEEIQISVRDRGLGISVEDLPHVFEPFYRGHSPAVARIHGTGLGLSIARSCAEACAGTISVFSEEGSGSSFTLHLPLHADLAARLTIEEAGAEKARALLWEHEQTPNCQSLYDNSGPSSV